MIRIYNSLTGKKELLPKPKPGKPLQIFVCGPTVYDHAHLGHARTSFFFDFFVKYLRFQGSKVFYLQNITDVDDKIIARAAREGKPPTILADHFTREYLGDMKRLGITAVNTYAPATKFIPQIVHQVETLIRKGYAYEIGGDGYYFDISKFKEYGKLSRRTALQAQDSVSRIDDSIEKRNKGDFCLWKFSKPGEPMWNTALGSGRPGWHIEDTAISEHYFGPQYEIHGGGLELKFPHHEAEVAQQEAASGKKPFVKLWMHTGMLTIEGEKMSKSLGNFITIPAFLEHHSPFLLRMAFLTHHYRTPMDYSEQLIKETETSLASVFVFLAKLEFTLHMNREKEVIDPKSFLARFHKAIEDDMNTSAASAELFSFLNKTQPNVWKFSSRTLKAIRSVVLEMLEVFDITITIPKIPSKINVLAKRREQFRIHQQFAQSDALRDKIEGLGYVIEDTPRGPFVVPRTWI